MDENSTNSSARPNYYFNNDLQKEVEAQKIIFQHAAIAILILKDNKIIDCNTKAEELLGYSWDMLTNHSLLDFSPEYQPNGILSSVKSKYILDQAKPFGEPFVFEWVYRRSNGTQFIASISINSFYMFEERFIILFLNDISDYKKTIAELNIYKSDLESLVGERNTTLVDLNQKLSLTVEELNATNAELTLANNELNKTLNDLHREVNIRKELHELLISNQEKFKSFIDQSSEGISIIDTNSNIVEWNKSLTQITEIVASDAINRKIYDLDYQCLAPSKKTDLKYQKIKLKTEEFINNIDKNNVISMEGEIYTASGVIKYISTSLFPIRLSKSYLIGRITRDITRLKNTETELREYQENLERIVNEKTREISKLSGRYIEIFNNTSDGIAIVSKDYILLEANPALQEMMAMDDEELYKGDIFESIPEAFHSIVNKLMSTLFQGGNFNNIEIELINSKGEHIPVELSANIIEYEDERAILTIARDIRERREMEKLILRTTIETEERERSRLAADLHDDIGPLLASLKMYVSVLQQRLENTSYSNVIEVIQNLIKNSIENVRTISNNISPHLIERFGLISAIYAEIENLKMLVPIIFDTNSVGLKFDKQVEIIIYRIIKELLNNTLKYANATQINLTINFKNSKLYIEYSDNGIGFDNNSLTIETNSGHGLTNIDNRVRSINGNYSIKTSEGKGFLFKLETPINQR
ncbi:MAG: PAS domain S-box protein [Bacteroidales bacterium]